MRESQSALITRIELPLKSESDELIAFLGSLEKPALLAMLEELVEIDELARKRVERARVASNPRELAKVFSSQLNGWRRSERFIRYGEAAAFASEIDLWLTQLENELAPLDAARALALCERLIESDGKLIERTDDSNGSMGATLRGACEVWLRIAALCKSSRTDWVEHLQALATADDYGVREPLLSEAHLLLNEVELRVLAGRFEGDLCLALKDRSPSDQLPYSVLHAATRIHSVAEALRDPELYARATLSYSPQPNELQKADIAERCLEFGKPKEALKWLEGHWERTELTRLYLLSKAYEVLGPRSEYVDLLRRLFLESSTVAHFRKWRENLPDDQRAEADALARERAVATTDPIDGAQLLLAIGDNQAAESLVVSSRSKINGAHYGTLVPLAELLEEKGLALAATICYRALLEDILARAYARAYSHAARYFHKLQKLASRISDYRGIDTAQDYEASIHAKHARKTSFWAAVRR